MKICYLSNVTQHLERLATAMYNRGHDVTHITFYDAYWPGIKIYNIGMQSSYFMKWCFPLSLILIRKILKKIKPDILHAHHIFPYGIYAYYSGFQPYVLSAWGSDVILVPSQYPFARTFISKSLKNADTVHVESKYVRDTVLKLGCSQNKIVVTPFGVDLNFFQRDKYTTEVKRLKHRNGLTGSKVVISVRKFEKVFNIDCLLRAIPLVISEFPNAKFIIKGFGSEERNLKKLADKLDITRYVLFKGKISFSEMPVYLSSADIYVSTAIADSTSVSMLEAMASSLPIITTSIPANKEWIKDNWNGLLFKPSDYEELAEKIIILLGDADMCNMFGERNRRIVSVRAQWSKTLDILEATYKKVCEGVCRI